MQVAGYTRVKYMVYYQYINIDNEEYLSTNTTLTKAVQNFILSTKRFTVIED